MNDKEILDFLDNESVNVENILDKGINRVFHVTGFYFLSNKKDGDAFQAYIYEHSVEDKSLREAVIRLNKELRELEKQPFDSTQTVIYSSEFSS